MFIWLNPMVLMRLHQQKTDSHKIKEVSIVCLSSSMCPPLQGAAHRIVMVL